MKTNFQPNLTIQGAHVAGTRIEPSTKTGVLLFSAADWDMLLMKPRPKEKGDGNPLFQIPKGTRRIVGFGPDRDMRDEDLSAIDPVFHEPLATAALRESREEVGLKPGNIARMFDMGSFTFRSVSKNIIRPLHMFAAEIKDKSDFLPFEPTTDATAWLSLESFRQCGREDHVAIAQAILMRVRGMYRESGIRMR